MKRVSRRERREELRQQKQRQRMRLGVGIIGIVSLIVAAVTLLLAGSGSAADTPNTEVVALGQQIYLTNCASCHGVNLEGQPGWQQANPDGSLRAPPHDETGHTWHHGNAALIESIRLGSVRLSASAGTSAMPAYKDILTGEEITTVLAYIKSTWPYDVQTTQMSR
jgi:mono/diheme cytochrome c family protein